MSSTPSLENMSVRSSAGSEPVFAPDQSLLRGRLRIESQIGYGSMGIVYRAQDMLLDREVAVKTLRSFDPFRLFQLKTEFRTLAGFSHPNLVQFYELAMVDDTWLLIMELVQGVELGVWLRSNPARSRVLKVFAGL